MQINGCAFMADVMAKFHRSILVTGWFVHERDRLADVAITGPDIIAQISAVGLAHPGAGPGHGFRVQCLRGSDDFAEELALVFSTTSGRSIVVNLDVDALSTRLTSDSNWTLHERREATRRRSPQCPRAALRSAVRWPWFFETTSCQQRPTISTVMSSDKPM